MSFQLGRRILRVHSPCIPRGTTAFPLDLSSRPTTRIRNRTRSRNPALLPKTTSALFCRHASSSAATQVKSAPNSPTQQQQQQNDNDNDGSISKSILTPLDGTVTVSRPLNPDVAISSTLNPPASTRPPPLILPTRDPKTSLFVHLFRVGKTYGSFYKNGLKAILTNRRLLKEMAHILNPPAHVDGADAKVRPTRGAILLRDRTRHDLSRLPLFGLVVLAFGEFTPLVVLAFPKLAPYTCRIPQQIKKLRTSAQKRKEASLRNLAHATESAALERVSSGHIARSLGLGSSLWDKFGVDPPFADSRANAAVKAIWEDDVMIRDGGGVEALEPDEVVLACEARAMDVRTADVQALRASLDRWIRSTTKAEGQAGQEIVRSLLIGLETEEKK